MREQQLVRLAMLVSMFGLFALFSIWALAEPEEVSISSLQDVEKEDVRIKGTVLGVRNFDNFAILSVAEVKSVDVVVFDKRQLNVREGDNVTISGKLQPYKGRKELVADSIRVENGDRA